MGDQIKLTEIMDRYKSEPLTLGLELNKKSEFNDEEMSVTLTAVSNEPIPTWYGNLILDHSKSSIRLDRFKDGAALRDTHEGDTIGVIEQVWIESGPEKLKKLAVKTKLSKDNERAKLIYADMKNGIRRNVSIGVDIYQLELLEEKQGSEPTYISKDWSPFHLAIVPDPRVSSVGVNRFEKDINKDKPAEPIEFKIDENSELEAQINEINKHGNVKIIFNKKMGVSEMTEEERKQQEAAALDKIKNDTRAAELSRINGLRKIAADFKPNLPKENLDKLAAEAIDKNKSVDEFQKDILELFKKPEALRTPDTKLDMSENDKQRFSIRKVILHQLGMLSEKELGIELEARTALKDKLGNDYNKLDGFAIPSDIMHRRLKMSKSERDMFAGLVVGTPASGGYTVNDELPTFMEYLKDSIPWVNAGVQFVDGLVGNIPFTRELDQYTYYHATEGTGVTESDITFGQETASPKKAGALARYSYEWLNQTSLAGEAYIEKRLAETCGRGFAYDIAYGTGSGQPKGIKNWTSVGSEDGANFDRSTALAMLKKVDENSPGAKLSWLGQRTLRTTLMDRKIDAGSGKFLVENNQMIGYDFSNTSKIFDANDLFFGSFENVLALYWDMLSIKASEYDDTAFPNGDVLVRALQFVDSFVMFPGEIVISDNVS